MSTATEINPATEKDIDIQICELEDKIKLVILKSIYNSLNAEASKLIADYSAFVTAVNERLNN